MSNITLYRHPLSGHSHRAELLLSLLGLEANIVTVDLMTAAQKSPEFLAKNPAGQVPVLEDKNEQGETIYISDSNAILVYLANRYDSSNQWLPSDAVTASNVQKYLSLAAGPVAFGPATARLVTLFGAALDQEKAISIAKQLLTSLDALLATNDWLAADHITIADVANYAYIARAPEGNVDLSPFPNVITWLKRIESLPKFVPMVESAVGLNA